MRGRACGSRRAFSGRGARGPNRAIVLTLVAATLMGCHDAPTAPASVPGILPESARVRAATEVAYYAPRDLGTPGTQNGEVYAINNSGIAVGRVWEPGQWSVRWMPDGRIDSLPLYPAVGIADDGTVGGNLGPCQPAVWHPATGVTLLTDPDDPSACVSAQGMSRSGVLWGYTLPYSPASSRNYLFMRTAGGEWRRSVLDPPPGLVLLSVRNAHAERGAVGVVSDYAFHWTREGGFTLFGVGSGLSTRAYAINGAGLIVGARSTGAPLFSYQPVRFVGGAIEPITSGTGSALAVNERGDILLARSSGTQILRADGAVVSLQVPDGFRPSERDMNDSGVVVGSLIATAGFRTRPVMWGIAPPPPPPDSFRVNAGPTYTGSEAATIVFTGAVSGGTPPFTYRWDYGDGTSTTLLQGAHSYPDNGTFVVTFSVTDATGRAASDTATAVVSNSAPSLLVRSGPSTTIPSGGSVSVDARYFDAGSYDGPWTLTLDAQAFAVPGEPAGPHYTGSASSSAGPPGTIIASVTLYREGPYHVFVTLRDKDGGGTGGPVYTVLVNRVVVPTTATSASAELLSMTLTASPSVLLSDVALATVRLGDGTVEGVPIAAGADGAAMASRRDVNGDGLVDLVLAFRWADLEAAGALSAPSRDLVLKGDLADQRQFEGRTPVPPRPPVVTVGGPVFATEGTPVALAATAVGGLAPLTYHWTFGDGTSATSLTATHAYVDEGTYTVAFTATDAAGLSATATTMATVANAPPGLVLEPTAATLYSGQALTVRGRVDDAGVADAPWRWSVSWPHGLAPARGELTAVPASFVASSVLRRAGSAIVPVRVVDADGASAEGYVPVTVMRLPMSMAVSPASSNAAERGDGLLTVTLRGTDRVAVEDVVVESVRLNGATVEMRGRSGPHATLRDAADPAAGTLVLKFRRDELRTATGLPAELVLQADLRDGRQVEARWTFAPR